MLERLQKVLAQAGVASRRQCEVLITEGKVKVNGRVVTELGSKVDSEKDVIVVKGKPLSLKEKKVYYVLNKPAGYISSVSDPQGRPTVIDLFSGINERLYPVGRLDYDTEGLLLITNDGNLTYGLTHPSKKINKVYHARVKGVPGVNKLLWLSKGVKLDDGLTAPARVDFLGTHKGNGLLEIEIHEGRNRQVRRMCEAVGHPVLYLKRIQLGSVKLGSLPLGQFRNLSGNELRSLRNLLRE